MTHFRADAVRFITTVIDNAWGAGTAAHGFDIDGIVEMAREAAGSYDVVDVDPETFWNIVDAHANQTTPAKPEITAEDLVIEAYRVTLHNILDGSYRDMIIDDEEVNSEEEARAYVTGIIAPASWNIAFVVGIASNIQISL